jgi:hypothetical protein
LNRFHAAALKQQLGAQFGWEGRLELRLELELDLLAKGQTCLAKL